MSLKLEVGKTYEMNDGQREHVVAYVPVNPITGKPNPRPYVAMSAGSEVYRYREDGAFFADGVPTSYDLVREHVPPPTALEICEMVVAYREANPHAGRRLVAIADKATAVIAAEKAKSSPS